MIKNKKRIEHLSNPFFRYSLFALFISQMKLGKWSL
jgi:hypothetical protein